MGIYHISIFLGLPPRVQLESTWGECVPMMIVTKDLVMTWSWDLGFSMRASFTRFPEEREPRVR